MTDDVEDGGTGRRASAWSVRTATPADADACAALAVSAWQRVHDSYTAILGPALHEQLFSGWQDAKARAVFRTVHDHPERALVAVSGQTVIGFVTFHIDAERRVGEIGNNAVDPASQGQGIATALYQAVFTAFRDAGMRVARVTTGLDEGHAPARAAYTKAGFRLGLPSITYYREL